MARTRDARGRVTAVVLLALSLAGGLLAAPSATAQDDTPTDPGDLRVEAGVAPGAGVPDPRPGEAFADPKVAQLQRTADDVQHELGELADRITQAKGKLESATEKLSKARAEREAAEDAVARQQDDIDELSKSVYTGMGRPDELRLLFSAEGPKDLLAGSSMVGYLRAGQDSKLSAATKRLKKAAASERAALGLERQATERKDDLLRRNGDAANRADAITTELRGPIDTANSAVLAQQAEQRKRNQKTAKNWKAYLAKLKDADITPPRAGSLRDPERFPGGLKPLRGANGKLQAGVARASVDGKRLLVLPKETIEAVTDAIDALGKPYVPRDHGEGPTSYSCDGLVRAVYSAAGLEQAKRASGQYAAGKRVAMADVQPGDLVFAGPAKYGVQQVGIALGESTMLAADGRLTSVAVSDLPGEDTVLGATRPSLGKAAKERKVPRRDSDELTWRCGGVELPLTARSGSDSTAGAWGGYPNGLIPSSALCGIGIGSHALRCDAAQSFAEMSRTFAARSGRGLCVTDSYRSFNAQVDLYRRKPALAAVPGTSNHGWGLALDMCGGIQSFGSAEYRWMAQNAPAFGWVNPYWARQGGGREEPWHWEYVGR